MNGTPRLKSAMSIVGLVGQFPSFDRKNGQLQKQIQCSSLLYGKQSPPSGATCSFHFRALIASLELEAPTLSCGGD